MQMGFYFDQTRCTGCYTCAVACKDWHDIPAGPARWRRVTTMEQGEFPDLFVTFLSASCYHCAQPACAAACPAEAIAKRKEDGVVAVDPAKCLGKDECDLCRSACPYGAPQFGAETNGKIQMCSFCPDRLAEGKQPICVAACPMRAMDAGDVESLKRKYGDAREAEGFTYSDELKPSIVFKPKVRS